MDSLLIAKIAELHSLQDSLIIRTTRLQTTIDHMKDENILLKSLPFLGVIAGGIITYLGQNYLKKKDITFSTQKEARDTAVRVAKEKRDSIAKIFSGIGILNFSLRELAYLEVDIKYQYYLSKTEKDDEDKKIARGEHYNDYKYIADSRSKIATAIGEITASFITYYQCAEKRIPQTTMDTLNSLTSYILELETQDEYDLDKAVEDEKVANDIIELRNKYIKYMPDIQDIAGRL